MAKRQVLRQCLGCREMKPKKELMRVVRSPEGEVSLDLRGKKPGRGAYVCPNKDCLSKALKSRAIERALEVKIEENLLDELKEQAEEDEDE
ncbi:MAG: RNase P modulator RnpM [Candidatus Scatomorpha sp.]|jgi:predicted RNA-binding protein YlxR (DUF448 family)